MGMVLLGFGDAANQTQLCAIIPTLQPKKFDQAYGWRTVVSSVGAAAGYFMAPYISTSTMEMIVVGLGIAATVSMLLLDRFVCSISPTTAAPKKEEVQQTEMNAAV